MGHFGFMFEENSDREITSWRHCFRETQSVFRADKSKKGGVFKFLRFEERF